MKNKLMALGIISMILLTGLKISISAETIKITTKNENTLYVGGSGPGNYTKIQDAIDNATDSDIIFIYSGTYFENLIINTHVTLIGENKYTTIIDGSQLDDVIYIFTERVNISNFTIQNSSGNDHHYTHDAGVTICWGYCNISNNILRYNKVGINVYNDNNIIANNVITSCWQNGIGILLGSTDHNNAVIYNEITNMPVGIKICFSSNDTFRNNILCYNDVGIKLQKSHNNYIINNNIFENNYGIESDASYNNELSGNKINSNMFYGLIFELSNNNLINKNIISNTINKPLGNYYGLYFEKSYSNNISRNIIECNRIGIKLEENSNENIIYNNDFCNSPWDGINALDECTNNWDNGKQGNYWDDYIGDDLDKDGIGDTPYVRGNILDNFPFIDKASWNTPPFNPSINGPKKVGNSLHYLYNYVATDPDGDDVYYFIDWGDGTNSSWLGPYNSGEKKETFNSWTNRGKHTIRIKAKDIYDAESSWSKLEISVPKNKQIPNLGFIDRIPWLQNLLRFVPLLNRFIDCWV